MNAALLDETTRAQIRARLLELRREHLAALGRDWVHDEDGAHLPNFADTTDDEAAVQTLNDTARAQALHDEHGLAAVDAALARLPTDAFGLCATCGNPIGAARLLAQPTAQRCVACQTAVEAQHSAGAA
ncbi:MAG: TraR/DksA family transcriptional regulator [Burkholderiaceae bacterium]